MARNPFWVRVSLIGGTTRGGLVFFCQRSTRMPYVNNGLSVGTKRVLCLLSGVFFARTEFRCRVGGWVYRKCSFASQHHHDEALTAPSSVALACTVPVESSLVEALVGGLRCNVTTKTSVQSYSNHKWIDGISWLCSPFPSHAAH